MPMAPTARMAERCAKVESTSRLAAMGVKNQSLSTVDRLNARIPEKTRT